MTTRKHNDFLDVDENDDEGSQGYDSEVEDLRKGVRSTKRRRVESDVSDEEAYESAKEEEEEDVTNKSKVVKPKSERESTASELPGVSKPLSKKNLVSTAKAIKRSGVVYLSRVPPFMKPSKLRSLLEPFGAINRIFLTPEDPASHTRRVRNGGNKKRSFTDGWVEFVKKKDAKQACELLNAKTIGGKKKGYYHDDVWNLFYLKGFKWNDLTEQIAAENAERSSRMRAEISKTRKENKEFEENVQRAKINETKAEKAAKREDKAKEGTYLTDVKEKQKRGNRPLHFKQTAVAAKRRPEDQPDQVKRVLSKIF
jgi:ESF2/ABP1 family protein